MSDADVLVRSVPGDGVRRVSRGFHDTDEEVDRAVSLLSA